VDSQPKGEFGGVVQYDFGKILAGGEFIRKGSLNKPPLVVLNAIASLQAENELEESRISEFLSEAFFQTYLRQVQSPILISSRTE
jgi:hypothetical protein